MDPATLTTFLGWTAVLHIGVLTLVAIMVVFARGPLAALHSSMLGVSEAEMQLIYVRFLAKYKMMALGISFVPYLALKLMGY